MQITLYDGNNWFRRRIETDMTGRSVSNCFYEIQNTPSYPIVIWDGFNSLKSRRDIYPDYKRNRKPAGESIYESQDTLKKVLGLGRGLSIQVDGYEADDIIAHVCRDLQSKGHDIFIESNDTDLAQLGVPMARQEFKIPPRWVALFKTVVGDSSDNIKGVKGFGKGMFQKFTEDQLQLLEAIVVSYTKESEERVLEHLDTLPITPSVKEWMVNRENRELIFDYHRVVNFIPIPAGLIESNTKAGSNQPELAQPIFEEFMI